MREAVVAGGGIGGLAAALGLARAGWRVRLFEQAESLRETGAGIQASPNAVRALDWLGLGEVVRREGSAPAAAVMREGRSGRTLYRTPLGAAAEARWGAPYLHFHRADLLLMLAAAARDAGVAIECGVTVTGYLNRPGDVRVDRATAAGVPLAPLGAAVLVGADGLRSMLRQQLNGREAPDFTGQVAWRALVEAERLPPGLVGPQATVWVGPGRHLVTYLLRHGRLVNVIAVEERPAWAADDWQVAGDPAELRRAFAGWHGEVTGVLDRVERCYLWGLFSRPEQVRWSEGRMALLGDAAHPMLPFMAQGAAQAIEDAVTLAACLAPEDADVAEALAGYERHRWPRAARVQARSRANGKLFHRRSGLGRLLHHGPVALASRLAPGFASGRLDWLYGHDATGGAAARAG